jgi:hypothetical protein
VDISIDFDAVGTQSSWHNWSLEGEMKIKLFHETWLRHELGKPHEISRIGPTPLDETERQSRTIVSYRLPWGRVFSSHDHKGGGTSITIQYSG